jgi:hypothetical protein
MRLLVWVTDYINIAFVSINVHTGRISAMAGEVVRVDPG